MLRIVLFSLVFVAQVAVGAPGPKVTLVVGAKAPALEKRVAEQLSADLRALFDAETDIVTSPPASGGGDVLLLGSPATNPAIPAKEFGTGSEQRHLLKSTPAGLIVGGGSP